MLPTRRIDAADKAIDVGDASPKRINYRKRAFAHYDPVCAHCGYGIPDVLEVAHVDGNRQNSEISNLVILCPNCHKMHDLDLISTAPSSRCAIAPRLLPGQSA